MKVSINNVRLAFPNIFEPKINDKGMAQFSAAFIFPPDFPQISELKEAIEKVGTEKFGEKWKTVKKEMAASNNLLIHDGNAKASLAGYEGNLYFNAYNKIRPTVVDKNTAPLTPADGKLYSGCYVNVIVDIWAQKNDFGKRINAQLQGVQFAKDGDAFAGGGQTASSADFVPVPDDSDIL